ncbi:uncharacterized protein [Zea mays]|nr:uncharacterized protein LOC103636623 [Zea mays]|eukprot:XP_008657201.1 uncharacterized protein LOC103636623 [Zea mays]
MVYYGGRAAAGFSPSFHHIIAYEWTFTRPQTVVLLSENSSSGRGRPCSTSAHQRAGAAQTAAMQGSGALPGLTGTGRGGGFLPCGSLGKRTPAGRRGATSVRAVDGASVAAAASAAADSPLPPVQVTWQIAVGALAGVTPFVVAGVEFGKRIIAQKKCQVCGGSGLVTKNDYYVRCQKCGGFLPWQSWRRFFTG